QHKENAAAIARHSISDFGEIAHVLGGRYDQHKSRVIRQSACDGGRKFLGIGDGGEVRDSASNSLLDEFRSGCFGTGSEKIDRHVDNRPDQNRGAPDERSSAVIDVVRGGIWRSSNPARPRRKKNCSRRSFSEIVIVGTGPPGRPAKPSPL